MADRATRNPDPWIAGHVLFLTILMLAMIVFFGSRLAALFTYRETIGTWSHLLNDFIVGSRLDLKTISTFIFPPYLLFLIVHLSFPSASSRLHQLLVFLGMVFLISCLLAAYINYQYLGVFKNHIDVFIFEFLDPENATEVIKTIWADFPVLLMLLQICLLTALFYFLLSKLPVVPGRHFKAGETSQKLLIASISLVLLAGAARGAISSRPLSISRATLSPDVFLNKIVMNGLIALYEADKETIKNITVAPVSRQELADAINYYQPGTSLDDGVTLASFLTKTRLKEPRPKANVVLTLMESFGSHLLLHQSPENNVLGSLEKHLEDDYFFTRFTSAANGTAQSLEKTLMGHAFRSSVSSSNLQKIPLVASAARVFEAQGYRTIFITDGRKTWANMNEFMLGQGFQEVFDEYAILREVPDAEGGRAWGVYDQYGYDFVTKLLREEDSQPLFIVLLTVTNHSPFEPPPEYVGYPVDLKKVMPLTTLGDESKVEGILRTYQYANNSLGDFVSTIKDDPELSTSTIIAASGDHELRYLFKINDAEISWKHRVPFYLYLPQDYRLNTLKDTTRFGSHKDILPTIYERLFHDMSYYYTGNDLLSETFTADRALAWNDDFAMDASGGVTIIGEQRYFAWQDSSHRLLTPVKVPDEDLKRLEKKANAYHKIQRAFTLMHLEAADPVGKLRP